MRISIIAPREDKPIAADLVKAMKEFKRENGSWNLVEVDTADGSTHVLIRV